MCTKTLVSPSPLRYRPMSSSNDPSGKTPNQTDTYGILGKKLSDVYKLYPKSPIRVVAIDGQRRYVTMDYVEGRINLNVSSDNKILSYTVEQ